ncbi:rRNA maturation RNase YbeY [Helicobacter saguini]|uniref:Endoribonuclease YbeY n=1 Tax=Helicobacter saguini TaxID=1548018 RepID=A0A347VY39_9HELI|nr:rRNA maturation RNase YbeY [Helicobacter saguini]MWV61376.1 rRNA maturation RNase YbeY [Helicobacter saguini]MWV67955.1 rRNA maturation RNase YbeY [Helicobacter saguini]MWV70578.1 rRNA maturation RNase YbeY [Helicobacter saguini]MWV72481.1 rRNA maturation RNase YbeY [Helicobacter saguini]TLD94769.1 rRNA maturation RNase YbeY [Helicobacter saguini]
MKVEILDSNNFLKTFKVRNAFFYFKKNIFYPHIYNAFKNRAFFQKNTKFSNFKIMNFNTEFRIYLEFLSHFILKNVILESKQNLDSNKFYIELIFSSESEIKKINHEYMGKNYATDVLSFPLEINFNITQKQCFGSIIINLPLALKNAKKFKHNLYAEISILYTHAFLHLLGFDHENILQDKGNQRKIEKQILKSLKITNSLIERAKI